MSAPVPTVAIIGAGISGLAQADVFQRCGYRVHLYERAARVGGVWSRAYPAVTLQNSAPQYHLGSVPWPFVPELHPTGAEILRYLEHVVAVRKLDVRLETEVVAAREAAGGGWDVTVRRVGEAETRVDHVDHLVVSIGQYTEGKARPELAGEATFPGRILTEREVTDLSMFDGKRVVVAGFGKSALDMACVAAERGAAVRHVFRTPRWALPRYILGLHMTWFLFNRAGSVMMPSWTHPTAMERTLHRARPVVRGFWSGLEVLLGAIARWQARGHGDAGRARLRTVLPRHPLLQDFRSAAALAPPRYYGHIGAGTIQPHHAELAGVGPEGVHLGDGTTLPADLLVLSLGSRTPTFPFLSDAHRALLEGEPDGPQLYRHLLHPRIPDLAFAGYNHGFMHVPAAEMGALWLVQRWRGEIELPPVEVIEREIEHVRAWKREHIAFEPSRSCAVNTRFQQYLDILLRDLGVSPYRKLPNVIAEVFGRYGAADYAGVVDSYLQRGARPPRRPVALPT